MIALLRSTDGNPDSRFEKYTSFLADNGIKYYTYCWDRFNNKTETINNFYYSESSSYGKRYKNTFSLVRFNCYLYKQLVNNRDNYAIIHACDFDTILPAILVRIFYKKKVIYDIFDWYVDSRRIKGIIKYLIYALEFLCIKLSSAVIVCEPERVAQIIFKPKITWILPNIPNCNKRLPDLPLNERLTIAYVGILGGSRGLEHLVKYAKSHPDVNVKVAGFGPLEVLFSDVNKYSNIEYYGSVKYNDALRIMNSADLIMAIYEKTNPNHILAAPNKYYEGLFLGKPTITTIGTIPGYRSINDDTGFAINEEYSDFEHLIDTIQREDIIKKSNNAKYVWYNRYSTYVQDFLNKTYLTFIINSSVNEISK